MPARLDFQPRAVVHHRPRPAARRGKFGQRGGDVDDGERVAGGADGGGLRKRGGGQRVEHSELQRQRAVGGAGDFRFEAGKFSGREPHGVGHGLAMREARIERRTRQPLALRLRQFDEIPEEVVVFYAQLARFKLARVIALQRGDDAAAFVAQGAGFVERALMSGADEAAVAAAQRQVIGEGGGKCVFEISGQAGKRRLCAGQRRWQRLRRMKPRANHARRR